MGQQNTVGRVWRASLAMGLVVGLGAGGLTGCATLGLSRSTQTDSTMTNQRLESGFRGDMLVSTIHPVRLRLRNGWEPARSGSLHTNADLEAYHPDQRMFLVVLGEDRSAVAQGTLDDQATIYLQLLKGGFTQVVNNQSRKNVDRVNTFPAVQYEVRGNVGQQAVAYLHTTVEMDRNYYQVVVWTPDSQWPANADAMRSVVQEFRDAPI